MSEPSPEPLALLYHGLDRGAKGYVVARRVFEEHFRALTDAGRSVVDPSERFTRDPNSATRRGEAILTFDDGLESDYDVAFSLLTEWNRRAIFFVNPALVGEEGRADWGELAEMARAGMSLGSHGLTHAFLSSMSTEGQRRSLFASKRLIEEHTGARVRSLSLPGGRFTTRTAAIARECGYEALYTSSPVPPAMRDGIWIVGRVAVRADWTAGFLRGFLERQDVHLRRMRRSEAVRRAARKCLGERAYGWLHTLVWTMRGT
jgi:peptidoglycan/xylan/chitin deacetylase (PgdA/CDA1 family)